MTAREQTIRKYLKGLELGSAEEISELFSKDGVVYSPLYGKQSATKFYKELFKDTASSRITPLHIFVRGSAGAAHFTYKWALANGKKTSFECVDVFEFAKNEKIKNLRIIYDTSPVRRQIKAGG